MKDLLLSALFFLLVLTTSAQVVNDYRSIATGNWGTLATWERFNGSAWVTPSVAQGYPGQNSVPGTVTISNLPDDHTVTLDVSPANAISSLIFAEGNRSSTLLFGGNNSLLINGAITINSGTSGANRNKVINVGDGSLTCASVSMAITNNNRRLNAILLSTGSLIVLGNIVMQDPSPNRNFINLGTGSLLIGGNITGGGLITEPGSVVNYNGATQIVRAVIYNGSVILSGSGTKDLTGVSLVGEDFTMNGTSSVSLTTDFTVGGSITLGNGTSFTTGSINMDLGGDWINNGSIVNTAGSTITFINGGQTIGGSSPTVFDNVVLAGSGTDTFNLTTTFAGNLSINSGVIADLGSSLGHTAGTLILGGIGQAPGTWGSTSSSAANQNDTFFAIGSPGILTVISSNYYSIANGNWNDNNTWSFTSGGPAATSFPIAGAAVIIEGGFTVAVTANAACDGITFESANRTNSLVLNTGVSLDVSGQITIPSATAGQNQNLVNVGGGTLNAGEIRFINSGNQQRHRMLITTGTVTVSGDITTDSGQPGATIEFTGAGTLNAGVGIFTTGFNGGTLTTFTGSTVNYNGANQTIKGVNYLGNLTLSGSGSKTLQTTTTLIGGNLTFSGTASSTTVVGLTINGNLNIGDGTSFTIAGFPITVGGTTTVGTGTSGTLNITSATGLKTFTGLVTVGNGATWTNNTANSPVTFQGGITNLGNFLAGTGIHTFNTNAQQLTGIFSIPNVTVTGVTLTNTNSLTVGTSLNGTGGLTQAVNAVLNLGGTSGITTLTASAAGNTVNYNGAINQTVNIPVGTQYVNLSFNGTTVSGIAAPPAASTLQVSGNWVNNGTGVTGGVTGFNPNGGTVIFNGSSSINGSTVTTFNNLQVAGASSLNMPVGDVNIAGNMDLDVTSIFIPSTGRVVFNGSVIQSLNANGKEFYGVAVNKTGGSFDITSSLPIQHLLELQSATVINTNNNLLILSRGITTDLDGAIGPVSPGATINGNVTVQRYMDAIGTTFRYLGSAVSSALPPSQWGSTIFTYQYSGATGSYVRHNTSSPLSLGTGYVVRLNMGTPITWAVNGPITTGLFTWNFSEEGWHLISNPYASAIRWFDAPGVAWDLNNIATTIAVTDNAVVGYPNYFRYWDTSGGSPSGWGAGPLVNGMVAMGQAFWVYAGTGGGSLTIREQAKENALGGEFYRQRSPEKADVLTVQLDNGKTADVAYLKLEEGANAKYEFNSDLKKLRNPEMNVYLLDAEKNEMVINEIGNHEPNGLIPIGFEVTEPGEYQLSFPGYESFSKGNELYLIDALEGITQLVAEGNYRFIVGETLNSSNDRFFLSMKPNVPVRSLEEVIRVYPNPARERLMIELPSSLKSSILLVDAQGRTVYDREVQGTQEINLTQYPSGMYLLKVRSGNEVIVKKIIH